ncbi:LacI family transcriptional regulator [Actinotalea sp. M2MS4P-6]|uniref:LacI family DNA-binding transcriptional regulator n=1 Tax=Actinotalea sp. M2MS4P-6 TaxID=2983762 RepID=UPI0021E3F574|nr:LacI family DNA-binding transcriptional regulator [Actinotalea sp. M2MS4P-6]MCV2394488.1 LacI family transcriptional regulator [Actinotalea sp. M2MS4P-6]
MRERPGAVTVRDVAARAGVALSTVSNVLNRPQVVAPETLARVTAAINELGYVRNDAARALRLGQSRAVGMIVSEATSPFFADVMQGASAVLAGGGYSTLLGNATQDVDVESSLIELFESQRVRGLLIAPSSDVPAGLASFEKRGVPVVFLDVPAPDRDHCSVAVDDARGGAIAVEHLLAQGRSHIALVRGPRDLPQIRERSRGARAAAEAAGARFEVITTSSYFVQAGSEAAAVIASRSAGDRPDALFAVNDLLAMGTLTALIDRGIGVPEDVALVGYDDISVAAAARRPLTTVRQPARDIGARGAALLMAEMDGSGDHTHEQTLFSPELVVRATSIVRH